MSCKGLAQGYKVYHTQLLLPFCLSMDGGIYLSHKVLCVAKDITWMDWRLDREHILYELSDEEKTSAS